MTNRYLGLDIGFKRIGMALSHSGVLACPLPRMGVRGNDVIATIPAILQICQQQCITHLVIGYPRHHDQRLSTMCQVVDEFVTHLQQHSACFTTLHVVRQDETFSTQQARTELTMSRVKATRARQLSDSIAACIILESYFKRTRSLN